MPNQQKLPPPVLLFSDFAGWVKNKHLVFTTTFFCYFRSSCGHYLLACSLDGTVAFCEFSSSEVGKALPSDEKFLFHKKTYGTSIKASKSLILSSIVENPDFLKVQTSVNTKFANAISTPAKSGFHSPISKGPGWLRKWGETSHLMSLFVFSFFSLCLKWLYSRLSIIRTSITRNLRNWNRFFSSLSKFSSIITLYNLNSL